MATDETYDVAVIGAGVFGAWTAYQLQQCGAKVVLFDAYGAGNSRSSSGGESRIIRMGYGPDEIYTRSAQRSLTAWQNLFSQTGQRLFHRTGVLWLAREDDPYSINTLDTLERMRVAFERLSRAEVKERYPQLALGPISWGIFEAESGVLMARQAVATVMHEAQENGVTYLRDSVLPPTGQGRLASVTTGNGRLIEAENFVFACGPWLPKMFPFLAELIQVTRQEVFFFGATAGDDRFCPPRMPVWIDFKDFVYAIPDLDSRGFKIAIDAHGASFDPDTGERIASSEGLAAVRGYLAVRLPALADAPVLESRVCQYENTSNGDFLIDLHPDFDNLWLVGGGSGHGFKHGPAVGQYVAGLISKSVQVEPRFTLGTKGKVHQRKVY